MPMLFNACPTCKGTLVRHSDDFGSYLQCIQCSRILEPQKPAARDAKQARKRAA